MNCLETCQSIAYMGGMTLGAATFIIGHPLIGLLAQPILAIKAIVHAILINYHWNHSKNGQGIALLNDKTSNDLGNSPTPKYMSQKTVFQVEDIPRLKQELERFKEEGELFATLKWMRGLAKCIIPIIGLFWALFTEIGSFNGSINLECSGCVGHDNHWTNKEALEWHIAQVEAIPILTNRDVLYLE